MKHYHDNPTIFEKWFGTNKNKVIYLGYYKHYWDKPDFWFCTNGGKRKNGDICFDLNINFGYFHFSYTNFDLQDKNNACNSQVISKPSQNKDIVFGGYTEIGSDDIINPEPIPWAKIIDANLIESPSKKAQTLGNKFIEGLEQGLLDAKNSSITIKEK